MDRRHRSRWTPSIEEGKANRLDALMTAADLTGRTTYLWQERAWAESGLDAGLDAAAVQYLGGVVTAGDEVEISPEDRARTRALGFVE